MSDVDTVKRMLNLCDFYGLSGTDAAKRQDYDTLAKDFNGIGPEWFHEDIRTFIDNLEPDLLPAAFVHDIRWSHSDGTLLAFKASNIELAHNCKTIAFKKYGWYDPRRYLRWRTGVVFARLCMIFGLPAFLAAYESSQTAKKE